MQHAQSKSSMVKFKIVRFVESNEVTTVPVSWLGKTTVVVDDEEREVDATAWPEGSNTIIEARAKEQIASSDDSSADIDAEYDRQKRENEEKMLASASTRRRKRKRDEIYDYDSDDESSASSRSSGVFVTKENEAEVTIPVPEAPDESIFTNTTAAVNVQVTPAKKDAVETVDPSENYSMSDVDEGTAAKGKGTGETDDTSVEASDWRDFDNLENANDGTHGGVTRNLGLNENKENDGSLHNNNNGNAWCVVKFLKSSKLTVIPSIWLTEEKEHARWPTNTSSNKVITDFIIPRVEPNEDWRTRSIREHFGYAESYAAGLQRIKALEDSDDDDRIQIRPKAKTSKKSIIDLEEQDVDEMSGRQLFQCTLNGFQEVVENQNKIINEIKMQNLEKATASTSGYTLGDLHVDLKATTMKMFAEINKKLSTDGAYKKAVESFLGDQGGADGHKTCVRMLECTMTDQVAGKFVFVGHITTKAGFSKTAIWQIMKGVAVERFKNHETHKYTFDMADISCSAWLRQAKFRMLKKKKKPASKGKSIEDLVAEEEEDEL